MEGVESQPTFVFTEAPDTVQLRKRDAPLPRSSADENRISGLTSTADTRQLRKRDVSALSGSADTGKISGATWSAETIQLRKRESFEPGKYTDTGSMSHATSSSETLQSGKSDSSGVRMSADTHRISDKTRSFDENYRDPSVSSMIYERELFEAQDTRMSAEQREISTKISIEYPKRPSIIQIEHGMRQSFLQQLVTIPGIDEISSSLSYERFETVGEIKEEGDFVEPLQSPQLASEAVDIEEEEMEEEEEELVQEDEETLRLTDDLLDEEDVRLLENIEAALTELDKKALLESSEAEVNIEAVQSWFKPKTYLEKTAETDARTDLEKMLREQTEDFLDQIIMKVLKTCDNPNYILRKNLRKRALMEELMEKVNTLSEEQSCNFFLNRKMVEHYKRKGMFRAILPDSPDAIDLRIEKLTALLCELDRTLSKEEDMKAHATGRIRELVDVLIYWDREVMEKEAEFHTLVLSNLIPEASPEGGRERKNAEEILRRHKNTMQKLLKMMDTSRIELAQIRLNMILKQHTLAVFREKMEQIQNLGNGYTLLEYENMRTEVTALSKKCEERNSEMNRAHSILHTQSELHAHVKEKLLMMRAQVNVQRMTYKELGKQQQHARKCLHRLKLARGKLRRDVNELSFQAGLLDKPALMLDFDRTQQTIEKKSKQNWDLRTQYNDLLRRIERLEKCS